MWRNILVALFITSYGWQAQVLPTLSSSQKEWKVQPFSQRYFVENKGQWANKNIHQQPISFAYDGQSKDYYFTKNAIQIDLN